MSLCYSLLLLRDLRMPLDARTDWLERLTLKAGAESDLAVAAESLTASTSWSLTSASMLEIHIAFSSVSRAPSRSLRLPGAWTQKAYLPKPQLIRVLTGGSSILVLRLMGSEMCPTISASSSSNESMESRERTKKSRFGAFMHAMEARIPTLRVCSHPIVDIAVISPFSLALCEKLASIGALAAPPASSISVGKNMKESERVPASFWATLSLRDSVTVVSFPGDCVSSVHGTAAVPSCSSSPKLSQSCTNRHNAGSCFTSSVVKMKLNRSFHVGLSVRILTLVWRVCRPISIFTRGSEEPKKPIPSPACSPEAPLTST
mmetsp:Transcript_28095/g.91829  ORF Transcript_28095/g.91829 Transcript_28095/m.91829 type:complete len:318 (+) Transcript_28095:77-1030(+)